MQLSQECRVFPLDLMFGLILSLFKAGFRVFHFIIFVDLMCLVHSNPRGKLIVQFNNRFVLLYVHTCRFPPVFLLIGI